MFNVNQELVDAIDFEVQMTDISYGRRKDAMDKWAYFSTPTPGYANSEDAFTGKANQPVIPTFDNFALRASGSDWSYTLMRDGLVQQAARKGGMNIDLMAFRPCVVYVNGEFLGSHNIREKVDEDYIKRHYDLNGAKFDMV